MFLQELHRRVWVPITIHLTTIKIFAMQRDVTVCIVVEVCILIVVVIIEIVIVIVKVVVVARIVVIIIKVWSIARRRSERRASRSDAGTARPVELHH